MSSSLRAAAGKVKITPEEETVLAGFGRSGLQVAHPPKDILDDLYARFLILDDGRQRSLILSIDCVWANEEPSRLLEMFPPGTRYGWAQAAGTDEANVQVCATHTHAAPSHYNEKYIARIREKIREMATKLVPVQVNISIGSSAISAYRRPTLFPNPDVPIDRTLYALMLEKEDGAPVAVLINFAVHPTILHPSAVQQPNRVSTECVGMAMNELEAHMGGGFVSLFTQGFSGDVAPVLPGIGTLEDSYGNVKKAGRQLFVDIIRALEDKREITGPTLRTAQRKVNIPTRDGHLQPFLAGVVSGISLGEVALLFAPGEIFNGYVSKIKQRSPFAYTIPISLTNEYIGYIPTAEAFRDGKGGYEMEATPFDERVDQILLDTSAKVLEDIRMQGGKGKDVQL
ncbi:hypothetical protein [Paenibacillus koleovorans]|uniref:hypothetical protein n=1 Tax=Paenibacillus koleovorans TaxID=121608 RepID=UPI000FD9A02B|nr:hypothetical protein [Paenibacillus koleovorans]